MLFSGCTALEEKEAGNAPQENQEVTVAASDQIMAEYEALIQKDVKPVEAMHFINDAIEKLPVESADEMLRKFEAYQKSYEENYMNVIFEGDIQQKLNQVLGYDFEKSDVDKIEDPEIKALLTEVFDGGYQLVNLEGMYYPFIDYGDYKKYNMHLSEAMKDYINLMAMESDKLMSNDAGLVISWNELAERTLTAEKFLTDHPKTPMTKAVEQRYQEYLGIYMTGLSNTPTFDWDILSKSNIYKVSEEVLNSYRKTINENKETITAKTMQGYIDLLEKNDFQLPYEREEEANAFNNLRKELLDKAMEELSVE